MIVPRDTAGRLLPPTTLVRDAHKEREHLQCAETGIGALGDDEYGQLIKGGLDRLARQMTSE